MQSNNRIELEKLPTKQLDQMLQDETADPETVRHILAVLQEREKDLLTETTDAEKLALQRYKLREKEGADKPEKQRNRMLRVASVAIVLCVLMVAMVYSVEAESFWGRLVRWTDSVIEFFGSDYAAGGKQAYEFQTDHPGLQQVHDAVVKLGVTEPVVPMWLPEGYELVFCEKSKTDDQATLVALFQNNGSTLSYNVSIGAHEVSNKYQKDDAQIERLEIQGVQHYIVRNVDKWVSIWTKDNIECSISMDCQEDVLYKILRSIYDKEEAQ